jgi:DNA-binding IclR family transcriptional regulator
MSNKDSVVPSVDRAFTVLEFLAQSRRGHSISELSRALSLPKSSIHLLLTTLERRGYLQKSNQTGKYRFGLKLISLSRTALEGLELRDEARPFLQTLMRNTGLTVHMTVLERNEAVIIEKVEAPGLIRVATWVGRRLDVNCTGAGKALIAFISEEQFDRQIKPGGLAKHNHKSIVSVVKLKRELSQIRKCGYSIDDEEDEIGLRCIGAPIFDSSGQAIASISVAGTTAQLPMERIHSTAATVKETALAVSSHLGYSGHQSD